VARRGWGAGGLAIAAFTLTRFKQTDNPIQLLRCPPAVLVHHAYATPHPKQRNSDPDLEQHAQLPVIRFQAALSYHAGEVIGSSIAARCSPQNRLLCVFSILEFRFPWRDAVGVGGPVKSKWGGGGTSCELFKFHSLSREKKRPRSDLRRLEEEIAIASRLKVEYSVHLLIESKGNREATGLTRQYSHFAVFWGSIT